MLIEIRIGPGKRKLVSSISYVKNKCKIPSDKIHRIPHITLYGKFDADYSQVQRIETIIDSVGRKYPFLLYLVDGFKWLRGEGGKVIYFNIVPSKDLTCFRKELTDKLLDFVPAKKWDKNEDFLFHSTLAYKLTDSEFDRIWSFISGKKTLFQKVFAIFKRKEVYTMRYFYLPMHALRITFLNSQSKIACEYDFLQKRLLSGREALSKREWQKTLRLFRIAKRMENCKDNKKSTYLISDLHLDHVNIIHYCARPF
jgi:2'-5' RNA ligase